MSVMDHWHPVCFGDELATRPVAVTVWNEALVVFRTSRGIAALEDRCPHRFFPLSRGCVKEDRLVCPYHSWSFDAQGQGSIPCNPKMHPRARSFDAAEHDGAIWVRRHGAERELPSIDTAGFTYLSRIRGLWRAPLELAIDNIAEVEHSPDNHTNFLCDAEGLKDLEVEVERHDDHLALRWSGQQRPTAPWVAVPMDIRGSYRFTTTVRVGFSPVAFTLDHVWTDPATGREHQHIRETIYFTPRSASETELMIFFYTKYPKAALMHRFSPLRPIFRRLFDRAVAIEFHSDRLMVEAIGDKRTDLQGMQLGIHDRALRPARALLQSLYYGHEGTHP
jgi:phenylpropionate dioxygenase-like ring-hydroxylating dioxygenase large terminal subunit